MSSSGGAALLNNAPEVIEHKKKTSKGDMVVVGRYLKGRLLGKVRVCIWVVKNDLPILDCALRFRVDLPNAIRSPIWIPTSFMP